MRRKLFNLNWLESDRPRNNRQQRTEKPGLVCAWQTAKKLISIMLAAFFPHIRSEWDKLLELHFALDSSCTGTSKLSCGNHYQTKFKLSTLSAVLTYSIKLYAENH